MGLAILPPRLKEELVEVENYLINQYNEIADYHKTWADELKSSVNVSVGNVHQVVQHAVGQVFVRVLEDAGVYKRNPDGQLAFRRFLETIGID